MKKKKIKNDVSSFTNQPTYILSNSNYKLQGENEHRMSPIHIPRRYSSDQNT
jgi:hypothetical protein